MKSISEKVWIEILIDKFPLPNFSVAIITGVILYSIGVFISLSTGNFLKFIFDYPWIIYSIYIIIGVWATTHFLKEHRKSIYSIRSYLLITDEDFDKFITVVNKRLSSLYSIPFSLMFFPILYWVSLNRLWWHDYNGVILYDFYSWLIFACVLIVNGIGIWVGCVAYNLNYRDICGKIPLNKEDLLFNRFEPLNKYFGRFCLKITLIYLIFSTLSNLPIVLLTTTYGAMMNFFVAFFLTFVVFIIPQVLFHNLIMMIKKEEKENIKKLYKKNSLSITDNVQDKKAIYKNIHNTLSLIQLSLYRQDVDKMREWLIDLRSMSMVILSLLLSTTIKIILGDILTPILSMLS
jgi:hypothetical protein